MFRTIARTGLAALIAATTISLAPPARAQIGNIFSDPAPRPPGNIPRGGYQQQPDDDEEVPELPQGRLLPTPNRPPPGQGVPPPGSVSSQPLAPPPGTTVIPQNTAPGIAVAPPQPGQGVAVAPPGNPLPGLPPGQRQPKTGPGGSVPGSAPTRPRGGGGRVLGRGVSRGTKWSPSRRPPGSSIRRRAFPGSTRSPAVSSISMRISARPFSSARCGARPMRATR